VTRLSSLLVRAAGGDPAVVLPLLKALRQDARGIYLSLRSRDPRGFRIPPESMHLIMLVIAALGSVGLVFAFIAGAESGRPLLGPAVLCVAQVLLLATNLVGQVVPALLLAEDELTVGWWPLRRRDLLLARIGTALVPALQLSAALSVVPLMTLVFTGRPLVLAAVLLFVAVLVQTVVLAIGAAALTTALVRAVGQRQARRLAAPLVDGNLAALPLLLLPAMEPLSRYIKSHPGVVNWLPPVWFARFGDPLGGPDAWRGMALAAALTFLVLTVGWRLATPRTGSPTVEAPEPAGRRRGHWTDILPFLLRPWLRGREGWVTGRLLAAHLRDDWRFGANTLLNVAVLGAMLWYYTRPEADGTNPGFDLLLGGSQTLLIMSMSIPFLIAFSSTPKALWVVALADLDAGRLLAAQRGLVRGLALVPLLVIMAVRGHLLGVGWLALAVTLGLMAFECELLLLLAQRLQPLLPFSRAYTRDQSSQTMLRGMALFGILIGVALVNLAAAYVSPVRYGLLAALPVAIWLVRRNVARRVAGSRLNVAEIVA
jgi:hypothetical protein